MSDIVELAYTLLLGWMSALTDWLWALLSGGGGGKFFSWLLEHWKLWLAILVIGGLAADWLIHTIRWQPYKVWFRRPVPEFKPQTETAQWDDGEGYYEAESQEETAPNEWTDLTLPMLSEIDENWAEPALSEEEARPEEELDPTRIGYAPQPYGDDQEELYSNPEEGYYSDEDEMTFVSEESQTWQEEQWEQPAEEWETEIETWEEEWTEPAISKEAEPEEAHIQEVAVEEIQKEEPFEEEATQIYGTTGFWPGQGIFASPVQKTQPVQEHASEPEAQEPVRSRRRRRGLRESERDEPPAFYTPPVPQKTEEPVRERLVVPRRQERLVQEDARKGVQTVTGRPAIRRGLMRFTMASEEPIAGLPPMRVEGGGFHPAARPDSPDFETDEDAESQEI